MTDGDESGQTPADAGGTQGNHAGVDQTENGDVPAQTGTGNGAESVRDDPGVVGDPPVEDSSNPLDGSAETGKNEVLVEPVGEGKESKSQDAGEAKAPSSSVKAEEKDGACDNAVEVVSGDGSLDRPQSEDTHAPGPVMKQETGEECPVSNEVRTRIFNVDAKYEEGEESGSEEEQAAFMKELENFFKEKNLEFKPPKFYGEGLNCLKLWRAVTRLGGYDQVTTCKLWRQVGESFKPPKTCTTISWSFRIFYEKALLEYEKHKTHGNELTMNAVPVPEPSVPTPESQSGGNQASGSGRARRDAAARAMQGWHNQRFLGNGEVSDPIIKDKSSVSLPKREKQLKNLGVLKRKKPPIERIPKSTRIKVAKSQMETTVVDIGPTADWVKISVRRTKDCFEVYALVPGLLREEVRVQSDPAGRLVISGEPEHLDNPWGVTPFKKVITLPSRIDPHQTSAVVTLHGQLFVRAPYEHPDM